MLIHTESFSDVPGLGLIHCGLGLEKNFGPRPRPHSFWPWPHAQLASLTSLLPYGTLHLTLDLENYAMIAQTEVDRRNVLST